MGKTWKIAGVSVVMLLVLAPVAWVGVVYAAHPRDEAAFIDYVSRYVTKANTPAVRADPQRFVADGDAACEWLKDQDWTIYNYAPQVRERAMKDDYVSGWDDAAYALSEHHDDRYVVVTAAWHNLCAGTLQFRIGYRNPFHHVPAD